MEPVILNESLSRTFGTWYLYHQKFDGIESVSKGNGKITWTEQRSGVKVPSWSYRIQHLTDASSEYTRTGSVSYSGGMKIFSCRLSLNGKVGNYEETQRTSFGVYPAAPGTSSKAINIALGNFLKDAGSQLSPVKGMVILGELKETLQMLRRPASALRDGLSSYLKRARHEIHKSQSRRKSRKPKAETLSKVLSGLWLEYAYGWQPLIGSIKDAAEAYSQFESRIETARCYGKGEDEWGGTTSTNEVVEGNYLHQIVTDRSTFKSKVKYVGAVKLEVQDIDTSSAQKIIQLSGFNLLEFVPTVYELIPYSMVVDYFTNIGDILNSIHGLTGNFVYWSRSVDNTTTAERDYAFNEAKLVRLLGRSKVISCGGSCAKSVWIRRNYTRSKPPLALPSLVLHLPASGFQWANILALAANKSPGLL